MKRIVKMVAINKTLCDNKFWKVHACMKKEANLVATTMNA